jgi:predicted RNA binding protein YcfA (HicA-like mRNA interferase family)
MGHLPQIKPAKLIRIIQKKGFLIIRQSGSHVILKHNDNRFTSVPNHRKTIGKGLLAKIVKDTKITVEELK